MNNLLATICLHFSPIFRFRVLLWKQRKIKTGKAWDRGYLRNHFASCTTQAVWIFHTSAIPRTAKENGGGDVPDFAVRGRGGGEAKAVREKPRPQLFDLELLDHLIFPTAAFFPRCFISQYGGKNKVCQATYWLLQVQKGNHLRGSGLITPGEG